MNIFPIIGKSVIGIEDEPAPGPRGTGRRSTKQSDFQEMKYLFCEDLGNNGGI
jgi:hypothetical protein